MKAILSITGSDSCGGAGIQADIKTISQLGGYAFTAITSITVQNTLGIQDYYDLPPETVRGQVEAIINDVQPTVVKVGLIRTLATLNVIVDLLQKYRPDCVIYDAVVRTTQGQQLIPDDVHEMIQRRLLPLCSVIIIGKDQPVGPLPASVHTYAIDDNPQHGYANGFSSALACFVSQGHPLDEALDRAQNYVNAQSTSGSNATGRCGVLYRLFLDAIADRGDEYHDVNYYADHLNVSARYLAQVTHRAVGLSPKQIVDREMTRVLQASLLSSTQPLQQLAYDHGFTSQQHFTKFFKKQTGMTPSQYRMRAKRRATSDSDHQDKAK